ncbi:MAG: hypothetical protein ABH838_04475 [Actinomycetota bacterium]
MTSLKYLAKKTASTCLAVMILMVVSGAAGCTSVAELITGKSATQKTTKSADKKTTAADQGPLIINKNDVPGQDLTDLSRPPDSVRQSDTIVKDANGKQSGVLIYQTGADVAEVEAFYQSELDKQDWTLVLRVPTEDGVILQLKKGKRTASVDIARREGIDYTDVTILYSET